MFNFFKKRCPVCKMELKEGQNYPEAFGKKFCSDGCLEEYQKQIAQEQSKQSSGGCCH